jgi:thiamine-monophosphate kinase
MGGIPRWALLSLAIPADLPLDFLDQFTAGFLSMAMEHGVSLIGGDTCSARSGLALSVTIMGEQFPEHVLRRSEARPGDEIWVTGTLGDAALGLSLLETADGVVLVEKANPFIIARLLDPTPRTAIGLALATSGLVTAMIDISDGLLSDFGHIAEMSTVGGVIHLGQLPLSDAFRSTVRSSSPFQYHLALSGGEDYELCFTAHPASREKIIAIMKKCGVEAAPVGIVTSSPEVAVHDAAGQPFHLSHQGFNHFAS